MFFELKEGESLANLIEYAGGFAQGAYTSNITVVRQTGKEYEVCTVNEMDRKIFQMKNGDDVEVGCNSVLNPGTVIGKNTSVYPLNSLRGVFSAGCIVKSQNNVVERR